MDENAYEIIRDGIQYKYHLGRSDMIKLIIGFWLIGLCNNIGFVVELTAAQDLIDDIHIRRMYDEDTEWHRGCTVIGTGTILLAAVVPSLFAKIFAPFLPLMIKIRYIIIIALSTSGYITTAYGYQNLDSKWIKILGIVFMSLSSGLGESSALAYIAFFPTDNALSAWSSGTGGAGFVGASIYTVLKQFGIDRTNIIMISLIWPIIMTVSFYALIPHPKIFRIKRMLNVLENQPTEGIEDMIPIIEDPHKFKVQLLMIKKTFLIYTLPF
ncbi:hypothetical protein O3M35_010840 [Rhynocoris fuscipes]|uniref:Battenin n=1 Tax=Rhynocoris fuscipes TaxID=488301 RepID=A0AAW1D3L4_9HEMI